MCLFPDAPESSFNDWLVAFNIIGKFGVTAAYCLAYIWSAELFPTSLRSTLMGASVMCGGAGQMVAPLVADIVRVYS